jgi:hypothetical protein
LAVMVYTSEAQILERQVTKLLNGIIYTDVAGFDLL